MVSEGCYTMEKFAEYILKEESLVKKMEIMYYLQRRGGIFFDNSVILKTQVAKMFVEKMNLDVDKNLVLTASLLYGCKKSDSPQHLDRIKMFPQESADYLRELGFDDHFCKICQQHSRVDKLGRREKESDVLELVDQFCGMLLHRPERMGFKVDEALVLLEHRNLKDKQNRYLEKFKEFIMNMEEVLV